MAQQRRRPATQPKPQRATSAPKEEVDTNEGEAEEEADEQPDDSQDTQEDGETGQQGDPSTAEGEPGATSAAPKAQTPATEPAKPPAPKKHFDAGRPSTKPEKPKSSQRPYMDTPRPFGVHINGILRRFMKGRTVLKGLLTDEEVKLLKNDPYVADNGAEVVTDED